MIEAARQVQALEGACPGSLPHEALEPDQPVLLKGLVSDWPAVKASRGSEFGGLEYLQKHANEATVNAVRLDSRHRGRVFYNDDLLHLSRHKQLQSPILIHLQFF